MQGSYTMQSQTPQKQVNTGCIGSRQLVPVNAQTPGRGDIDNIAHALVMVETEFWSMSNVYQSDHFRPLIKKPNFFPVRGIMGHSECHK